MSSKTGNKATTTKQTEEKQTEGVVEQQSTQTAETQKAEQQVQENKTAESQTTSKTESVSATTQKADQDPQQERLEELLKEITEVTAPGLIVPQNVGAALTNRLARMIDISMELEDKARFAKRWQTLVTWVRENAKGVANEKYIYRFLPSTRMASESQLRFAATLDLIRICSVTKDKTQIQNSTDLNAVLNGRTAVARDNINSLLSE